MKTFTPLVATAALAAASTQISVAMHQAQDPRDAQPHDGGHVTFGAGASSAQS